MSWAPPVVPIRHPQHVCTPVPRSKAVTVKRRPKFGVFWLTATLLTGGLALGLYLIWPRHHVTVSVDRWTVCSVCNRTLSP